MPQPRRSPYAPPQQDDDEPPRSPYDTIDNPGGDASDYEQPISGDQGGAAPLEDLGTGGEPPAAPASGFASPYESAAPAAARPESDIAADATPATSKYQTAPAVDWATQAPEAAGYVDGFSTSPENRQPRSQEPISKYDIPKIGDSPSEPPPQQPTRSKAWQAVDDTKAKIDAIHQKLTGFGAAFAAVQAPGLIRMLQGEEA